VKAKSEREREAVAVVVVLAVDAVAVGRPFAAVAPFSTLDNLYYTFVLFRNSYFEARSFFNRWLFKKKIVNSSSTATETLENTKRLVSTVHYIFFFN
jgi:hypothetical protein